MKNEMNIRELLAIIGEQYLTIRILEQKIVELSKNINGKVNYEDNSE